MWVTLQKKTIFCCFVAALFCLYLRCSIWYTCCRVTVVVSDVLVFWRRCSSCSWRRSDSSGCRSPSWLLYRPEPEWRPEAEISTWEKERRSEFSDSLVLFHELWHNPVYLQLYCHYSAFSHRKSSLSKYEMMTPLPVELTSGSCGRSWSFLWLQAEMWWGIRWSRTVLGNPSSGKQSALSSGSYCSGSSTCTQRTDWWRAASVFQKLSSLRRRIQSANPPVNNTSVRQRSVSLDPSNPKWRSGINLYFY